jgi:GDP-L-fucose synthase
MSDSRSPHFLLTGKRVWVAGHRGMVGSAIVRRLGTEGCTVLTVGRGEVDLRRQAETEAWIAHHRPEAVFLAAATVGGIHANDTRPAGFIYDNLAIQTNVIHGAFKAGVGKLLFLGSSCIYPRHAEQPIIEDALLTGPLEPTNEWYAIAKIAGIKLCQAYRAQYGADFISAQPTNLYGPFDNFDLTSSHVLPALIAKAHAAKCSGAQTMEVWGTGTPRREFLHVDDLADALVQASTHRPKTIGATSTRSVFARAMMKESVVLKRFFSTIDASISSRSRSQGSSTPTGRGCILQTGEWCQTS